MTELLGEGGIGAVWLAERTDGMLQRPVALKLPRGVYSHPELAGRIAEERDILASLKHPHSARIYDAGFRPGPAISWRDSAASRFRKFVG